MSTKYKILFSYSIVTIVLDQITKVMILNNFRLGEKLPVINGFFDITHIRNTGAAFGLLANAPDWFRVPFFLLMPVVALVVIGVIFKKLPPDSKLVSTALSLVIGGAIGNLIDRARLGSVVDFILVHWKYEWRYPAFNVADSAICIGVGLLMIDLFYQHKKEKELKAQTT